MTGIIREIVFDTETTGLRWRDGDRVIELGCVELINHVPSGKTFQARVNPGRPVSEKTIQITGITDADLQDKPRFSDACVVDRLLDFIGDCKLVAHNADFDRNFLNMELEHCGKTPIPEEKWIDTVKIARKKYPGAPASLDALCKRFQINTEKRVLHGALLDSQLLAEVYLELLGGRERGFDFQQSGKPGAKDCTRLVSPRTQRAFSITDAEKAAHAAFVATLGDDPVWKRYL